MDDVKSVIAKNISELRQANGLTQLELAEKLNYSDKAVSKWEHADSIPDISVLLQISELFGVSLDYLVKEEHKNSEIKPAKSKNTYRHGVITAVSIISVWFTAVFLFVLLSLILKSVSNIWLCYIYAIPLSSTVWLIFNSIWFNKKRNYFIISILMWSALLSLHLTFLSFGFNIWLIYLLAVPGQIIILLWSVMNKQSKD